VGKSFASLCENVFYNRKEKFPPHDRGESMRLAILIGVLALAGCSKTNENTSNSQAIIPEQQVRSDPPVELVDVLVAARDLPGDTTFTREELKNEKLVKVKKIPKADLPPAYVTDKESLVDKQLIRFVRVGEAIHPDDLLSKSGPVVPVDHNIVSLPLGFIGAGFIGPGSRVDVVATVRKAKKLESCVLLTNLLVVSVNTQTIPDDRGSSIAFPNLSTVSVAVHKDGKEVFLLSLAKSRGCHLELILRHPDTSDPNEITSEQEIIDRIKLLLGDDVIAAIHESSGSSSPENKLKPNGSIPPGVETVKVLLAERDVPANTVFTRDLLVEAFEWRELPKEFAEGLLTADNYKEVLDKPLKTRVWRGQLVKLAAFDAKPKTPPKETTVPPKEPAPVKMDDGADDVDVAVTTSGTVIHRFRVPHLKQPPLTLPSSGPPVTHRYVEIAPGKWKKVTEVTPEEEAKNPVPDKK
jgi:Flp pilus assembly protein CpaB